MANTIRVGNKVNTLQQLNRFAGKKKAVICPMLKSFNKPIPAVVILNMQGTLILRLFEIGLFVYKRNSNAI